MDRPAPTKGITDRGPSLFSFLANLSRLGWSFASISIPLLVPEQQVYSLYKPSNTDGSFLHMTTGCTTGESRNFRPATGSARLEAPPRSGIHRLYKTPQSPWKQLRTPRPHPPTDAERRQVLAIKKMGGRGSTGRSYLQGLPGIKGFLAPAYLAFGSTLIASTKSGKTRRSLWV